MNRRRAWLGVGVAVAFAMSASGALGASKGTSSVVYADFVSQASADPNLAAGESWVVTDHKHPERIVVSWNNFTIANTMVAGAGQADCGVANSVDGGRTWSRGRLSIATYRFGCGDPILAADPDGTLYAGGVDVHYLAVAMDKTYVMSSRDGGQTWTRPVDVFGGPDKTAPATASQGTPFLLTFDRPDMVVDPNTHKLYISLSDDGLVGRSILVSRDRGKTWSVPRPIDAFGANPGTNAFGAAHGTLGAVYVADPNSVGYQSSGVSCPSACAVFETSVNDGVTWSSHIIPGAPSSGLVSAADPKRRGHFAVMAPTASATRLEIWMTKDSGLHWTKSKVLSARAGDSFFKWWLNYSPTGVLGVETRTKHPNGSYDVNGLVSQDGGFAFGPLIFFSPQPAWPVGLTMDPNPTGDDCACNVHVDATSISASWPDTITGQRQVYFSRYYFKKQR